MRLFVVCVVAVVLSACRDNPNVPVVGPQPPPSPSRWVNLSKTCTEDSPATTLPADLRATIETAPSPYSSSVDAYITRTNEGGWGGRAFRNGDHYDMYFVDTTRTSELFATLRQRGILVPDTLNLLDGRWDYAQLYEWARYLNRTAFGKIIGYGDIDVPLNRIDFTVQSEDDRLKIDSAFSVLDVPCFLATIAVQPPGPLRGL